VSATPPARGPIGAEPETPPGNEVAASLWIVAVLIAVLELAWWLFDRMYSG
jgi:hypothetical protein